MSSTIGVIAHQQAPTSALSAFCTQRRDGRLWETNYLVDADKQIHNEFSDVVSAISSSDLIYSP
jgi:hypothetical protein